MRRTLLNSTVVLTALLMSAPAIADQGRRGPQNGGEPPRGARAQAGERVEGRATERAVPRRDAAPPTSSAPRAAAPEVVRPNAAQPNAARPQVARPNAVAPVRPYDARSYGAHPYVAKPYVARPYYAPRSYYGPYYPSSHYYVRPYYTGPYYFRPHFTLGFGFYAGYPVPYAYPYPYAATVYGYGAPAATVNVGSNSTVYGGVALEITPGDASVYVDGGYAGLVRDFDGTERTLTLATGRHRVEISAAGYQPMAFDVDTVPGQIVPYRGDLQPLQ